MRERIAEAMLPHLFDDDRPAGRAVAELGDLGGAIGASLLTPAADSDGLARRERERRPLGVAADRPRSPGWITLPPSSRTRASAAVMSSTVK